MKKTLSLMIAAGAVALLGFSAPKPMLSVAVGTKGPDRYADGTDVLVGETYLVVYLSAGADFAGVYPDGSLVDPVNNKLVAQAPAVQGKYGVRCAYRPLDYSPADYPEGGRWLTVLLDTRRNDGSLGGLIAASGAGEAVETPNAMSGPVTLANAAGSDNLVAKTASPTPADAAAALITAIRKQGDAVELVVENMSANALYQVQGAATLDGGWEQVKDRLQVGDQPAAIDNPRVRFFKVVTQP